jgi:poly(A) polymerase
MRSARGESRVFAGRMDEVENDEGREPESPGVPAAGPAPAMRSIPAESIPESRLDQDALRVVSRLQRHGFEAYFVGGCVRDLLIGRIPKDYDVATSAHPRQIRRLFRNARIIGRRFRLAHITYGDHVVETATFRREPDDMQPGEEGSSAAEGPADSADSPRESAAVDDLLITQDNVFGTAAQDAQRRDFSINALFLDPTQRVILDYVGGLADLEAGILRTIGDPMVRMAEDPVRILRAVKFATRLSFRIEDRTWEAMSALAPQLARSAPPRVLEEVLRLLRSGSALGAVRMLRRCGALKTVLPDVDRFLSEIEAGGERDRADASWRLLEALDNDVHAGYSPSTPVCLALLYLPLIEREAERTAQPGQPPDILATASRVLEPIALATRVARRDSTRAIRILDRQRRFTQPASRHFRPLLFVLGEEFPEALELFRLRAAARGQGWDIYEGWLARRDLALNAKPEEIDAERRAARKRRRRRRRRGPRGPGAQEGGEPAD